MVKNPFRGGDEFAEEPRGGFLRKKKEALPGEFPGIPEDPEETDESPQEAGSTRDLPDVSEREEPRGVAPGGLTPGDEGDNTGPVDEQEEEPEDSGDSAPETADQPVEDETGPGPEPESGEESPRGKVSREERSGEEARTSRRAVREASRKGQKKEPGEPGRVAARTGLRKFVAPWGKDESVTRGGRFSTAFFGDSEGKGRIDHLAVMVGVLAVIVLVFSLLGPGPDRENWIGIILLALVFAASEFFSIRTRDSGRLTLAIVPVMVAMMHAGPLGVVLVTLAGIPVYYFDRGKDGLHRVLFNTAQYMVAAGAAALVFWYTGGKAVLVDGVAQVALAFEKGSGLKFILPAVLGTLVFFLVNTFLVAPVLAHLSQERALSFWEKKMLPRFPGYLFYACIGFLTAIAYSKLQFTAVVMVMAILLGTRQVFKRYGAMRDVCDETAVAVMSAVEAGNSIFNEGHSAGVADMAGAIAEVLEFQEEDVYYMKQAALFHDIGKLGIDSSAVSKPGVLTPEEYEEMKKHPIISASIVAREPSLAPVASTVIHHHEMVDGSGYVDGLSGETIPIGARILAVANAYDAMQRRSPHRRPLSAYAAASEIIKSKGMQYDPEVVDAFVKVVTRRGIWKGARTDRTVKLQPAGSGTSAEPDHPGAEPPAKPSGGPSGLRPSTGPIPAVEPEGGVGVPTRRPQGKKKIAGATPAEGIVYQDVRSEIEKDIRQWKRTGIEKKRKAQETKDPGGSPSPGRRSRKQEGSPEDTGS